jgi:hypothetical protein
MKYAFFRNGYQARITAREKPVNATADIDFGFLACYKNTVQNESVDRLPRPPRVERTREVLP